jgi:hypothetical protein
MTAFAVAAFFQLTFIPGFIFLKFFRLRNTGFLGTIIYSFGLSLLINYLLVYHLTLAGIYVPVTVYAILVIELILAVILVLKKRLILSGGLYLDLSSEIRSFPQNIMPVLSILAILGSIYFFFADYMGVFTHWDAVFSWNRWAIDWYLNDIPALTYLYPQLIPANWSLSYMMMQDSSLQFTARSIMSLFAILVPVIFFDLYLKKKKMAFPVSIIFFSILVLLYSIHYIGSGYVDFASAFLSAAALHAMLITDNKKPDSKNILTVFMLASAAAAAKQAGLVMLVFAIIWFIWLMAVNRKSLERQVIFKNTMAVLLVILVSLYWYIVKAADIAGGRDFSTLKFLLVDIHHDAGLWERFLSSLGLLRASPVFLLVLAALSLMGLFNRKSRWFTMGITIPSFLLWALFFSYDDRNIIMTFPFLAWSGASGFMFFLKEIRAEKILAKFSSKYPGLFRKRPDIKIKLWPRHVFFLLAFSLILGLIFLAGSYGGILKEDQLEKQSRIGNSSINEMLYDYREDNRIDGKIITDYYWVTVLPGFEGTDGRIFLENDRFTILSNSDSYELVDPNTLVDENTFGFLISDMYYKHGSFKEIFQSKIAAGDYSLIFSINGYHFIRINR